MALRVLLIGLPFEDVLVDELLQPGRQDVVRDPGGLEVLESASAEQGVSHDEKCPPLSDHVECACDGAGHACKACMPHSREDTRAPCKMQADSEFGWSAPCTSAIARTEGPHRADAGSGRVTAIQPASSTANSVRRPNTPGLPSHCRAMPIQTTATTLAASASRRPALFTRPISLSGVVSARSARKVTWKHPSPSPNRRPPQAPPHRGLPRPGALPGPAWPGIVRPSATVSDGQRGLRHPARVPTSDPAA